MSRTELPGVPSVPVRMSKETTIGGRMRYRLLIAGFPSARKCFWKIKCRCNYSPMARNAASQTRSELLTPFCWKFPWRKAAVWFVRLINSIKATGYRALGVGRSSNKKSRICWVHWLPQEGEWCTVVVVAWERIVQFRSHCVQRSTTIGSNHETQSEKRRIIKIYPFAGLEACTACFHVNAIMEWIIVIS